MTGANFKFLSYMLVKYKKNSFTLRQFGFRLGFEQGFGYGFGRSFRQVSGHVWAGVWT